MENNTSINISSFKAGSERDISYSNELEISKMCISQKGEKASVSFNGRLIGNGGFFELTGRVNASFNAVCSRCLKVIPYNFDFYITERFANAGENDDPDFLPITDGSIDIANAVDMNVFIEMPSNPLCDDDCKGLCSRCGGDLNENGCTCVPEETE